MCGRFSQSFSGADIAARFHVELSAFEAQVSYNIAPSQPVAAVIDDEARRLITLRWGLIPHWSKEVKSGYHMINARAETLCDKRSFKEALRLRRCIVVADGFYEWKHERKDKMPFYIRLKDHSLFGFAGLYDRWVSPGGEVVDSCTIITTESNKLIKPVHDRMPVILSEDNEPEWLDPSNQDTERLQKLLKPHPSHLMELYRVSNIVNSPANNTPSCREPF